MWGNSLAKQAMYTAQHTAQAVDALAKAQERYSAILEMHVKTCGDLQARAERDADSWREGLGKRLDQQDSALGSLKTMLLSIGGGTIVLLLTCIGVLLKEYVIK